MISVKKSVCHQLYINLPKEGYTEDEPSVQYRGIFLNDEYNLNQWSTSMGDGNMNKETYEKIYELILRLKANTLWPAMHQYSNAFHLDAENAVLADKYGISERKVYSVINHLSQELDYCKSRAVG